MRLIWVLFAVIMLAVTAQVIESKGDVDIEGPIGERGLREFFLAVGDYYRVPQKEIIIIKGRGFPPHDVPVVLSIAKRGHVEPEVIMDLRLSGYTWLDITLRFGLNPEIFYVPVDVMVTGPPYGKAYGYYKKKPKKEWKTIVLSDGDVTNLVNLKFISEHYGYPPEKIIEMRSRGKEFVSINEEIRKERKKKKRKDE